MHGLHTLIFVLQARKLGEAILEGRIEPATMEHLMKLGEAIMHKEAELGVTSLPLIRLLTQFQCIGHLPTCVSLLLNPNNQTAPGWQRYCEGWCGGGRQGTAPCGLAGQGMRI